MMNPKYSMLILMAMPNGENFSRLFIFRLNANQSPTSQVLMLWRTLLTPRIIQDPTLSPS